MKIVRLPWLILQNAVWSPFPSPKLTYAIVLLSAMIFQILYNKMLKLIVSFSNCYLVSSPSLHIASIIPLKWKFYMKRKKNPYCCYYCCQHRSHILNHKIYELYASRAEGICVECSSKLSFVLFTTLFESRQWSWVGLGVMVWIHLAGNKIPHNHLLIPILLHWDGKEKIWKKALGSR